MSAETRRHILSVAEELGYSPHPMVSALMSEVRRNKVVEGETVLAMLDFFTGSSRLRHTSRNLIYEGAAAHAKALGYRIDLFEPVEEGWRMEHLAKILRTRGIHGLVVPPLPSQPDLPSGFPWEDFTVVTVGFVCRSHAFHSVSPDQLAGMEIALSELSKQGIHRVGLYISAEHDRRVRHAWSGLFHWHWATMEQSSAGDLLHFYEKPHSDEFLQWVDRQQPEAVITDYMVPWQLQQKGQLSADLNLVNLIGNPGDFTGCGINQNYDQEGAAAIELLSTQLYRNERGAPAFRMNVQISPSWMPGKS